MLGAALLSGCITTECGASRPATSSTALEANVALLENGAIAHAMPPSPVPLARLAPATLALWRDIDQVLAEPVVAFNPSDAFTEVRLRESIQSLETRVAKFARATVPALASRDERRVVSALRGIALAELAFRHRELLLTLSGARDAQQPYDQWFRHWMEQRERTGRAIIAAQEQFRACAGDDVLPDANSWWQVCAEEVAIVARVSERNEISGMNPCTSTSPTASMRTPLPIAHDGRPVVTIEDQGLLLAAERNYLQRLMVTWVEGRANLHPISDAELDHERANANHGDASGTADEWQAEFDCPGGWSEDESPCELRVTHIDPHYGEGSADENSALQELDERDFVSTVELPVSELALAVAVAQLTPTDYTRYSSASWVFSPENEAEVEWYVDGDAEELSAMLPMDALRTSGFDGTILVVQRGAETILEERRTTGPSVTHLLSGVHLPTTSRALLSVSQATTPPAANASDYTRSVSDVIEMGNRTTDWIGDSLPARIAISESFAACFRAAHAGPMSISLCADLQPSGQVVHPIVIPNVRRPIDRIAGRAWRSLRGHRVTTELQACLMDSARTLRAPAVTRATRFGGEVRYDPNHPRLLWPEFQDHRY